VEPRKEEEEEEEEMYRTMVPATFMGVNHGPLLLRNGTN
jgi:hypothetical protein